MNVLLAVMLALNFNTTAKVGLYEVTTIISQSSNGDTNVESVDFIRTDIRVTPERILLMEAVGHHNKMVVTTIYNHDNVVDFKVGNNEEGEPFEISIINPDTKIVTTYLLYDLNDHYE